MRSRFIIVVLVMVLSCAPQMATVQQQSYERVVEVNLTKQQIYNTTLQWMAESFKSSKNVIELKDPDAGVIIGNGAVRVTLLPTVSGLVAFTMRIDIKDGKYRIRTYNYDKGDHSTTHIDWYRTKATMDEVNQEIQELERSLYNYLTTSSSQDAW